MALLPPTPVGVPPGHSFWNDWYERIRTLINNAQIEVVWANIDFTGSNLTSIATRNHNDLQNVQGGGATERYHLTAAEHTGTGTGNVVRENTPTLVTPVIGAATGTSVNLTGGITTGNTILHTTSAALSNGAGAGAGTLTNAPTAGDPTKWISINDNGTTRYIPTWT
jgi:hypothetical protein